MADEQPTQVVAANPAEVYRQLWQRGGAPDLRGFVAGWQRAAPNPEAAPLGLGDLLAVVRVDQEERWKASLPVSAEQYLLEFPTLAAEEPLAITLIANEFRLREEQGPRQSLAEFVARFPLHSARLRDRLESWQTVWSGKPTTPGTAAGSKPGSFAATVPGPAPAGPIQMTRGPGDGTDPHPGLARPAAAPAACQLDPKRLGEYEIVRELGRGGMGVVYEALDRSRGRRVALKVMQWLDHAALYRFKQEFRALADLHHPNLVTLHELVAAPSVGGGSPGPGSAVEGCWFFTMELIDGQPFLDHVRGRTGRDGRAAGLSPEGVQRLRSALGQLAEGVAALHAAGRLHRDIKPGNALVARDGRAVLLDFGLAVEVDRDGQYLSQNDRLTGTLPYMAPEQAACQPVSPASDWYAVGAMLYEALTGRPPFVGPAHAILRAKAEDDPAPPASLAPDVPPDLAALALELLSRAPGERPPGEEVIRRLGVGARPSPTAGHPGIGADRLLVGRSLHLAALRKALAEARGGRTAVVALHGRSGAGKSALLRTFLEELRSDGDDVVVLAGKCYEQESVPYKALDSLIDALSRFLGGLPTPSAEALLPRDLPALTSLFPVLKNARAVERAPQDRRWGLHDESRGGHDPHDVRRRAVEALAELLGRVSDRRPLVLAIDDLQWGDRDSAALLRDLLAPPAPALLLIGAYRSEDAGGPCPDAVRSLMSQPGLVGAEVEVEPLAQAERVELALALLGARDEAGQARAEWIARQSGGYPFFVHELARSSVTLSTEGPGGSEHDLAEVLGARVAALPEEARRLLTVVAVAGRPIGVADAAGAAGVPPDAAEAALAGLRAGRLVRGAVGASSAQLEPARRQIESYHDRIRETVVAALSPGARAGHHRALAAVLERTVGVDPEVLAAHHHGAGNVDRAGFFYERAADRAAGLLAFEQAAGCYQRALSLGTLTDDRQRGLRTRLGNALAGAGRGAEAAREYLAAARTAEAAGGTSGTEAIALRGRAALQLLRSGHVDEGMGVLRTALASVGLSEPATPFRAFWGLVARRIYLRLRGLGYRRRAEADVPPDQLARLDVCWAAALGLSMVEPIRGACFQSQALILALRAGEPVRLTAALAMEAAHESVEGTTNVRRTEALLEAAGRLGAELGTPYARGIVAMTRGVAAALRGDWAGGLKSSDEAAVIFREQCTGVTWELGTTYRFALWPLMYLGDVQEMARRLPRLIKEVQGRDDRYAVTNLVLVVRTFERLAANDPDGARRELHGVMDRWSQAGFHVQHMNRLFDECQIDIYEGRGGQALGRVRRWWGELARSRLLLVQQVRIFMHHLRARCALAGGGPGDLKQALGDARRLERERAPWATALARLLRAGAAARAGQVEPAIRLLLEGAAACDQAGMRLYAAAARWQAGGLRGGSVGVEGRYQAEVWMSGRQVAAPARMAGLLVPGCAGNRPG